MDEPPAGAYAGLGALEGSARGEGNVTARLALMGELHPLSGGTLVDIGCGNGAYTRRLAAGFTRVVAVDVEPDRLDVFRASEPPASIDIRLGDAADLGLDAGSVDLVTAIETFEHLGGSLDGVVRECRRILRPGGTLLLTTPNRWFPIEQHGWLRRGRRRPGWQAPGLTWVRPIHRRYSDAATFTPRELDGLICPTGFERSGLRYMMPPLDGHAAVGAAARPVLDLLRATPLRVVGQTLVMAYRRTGGPDAG